MEQQRDGTKYYVKNPKGLNFSSGAVKLKMPQGKTLTFRGTIADEVLFEISGNKWQVSSSKFQRDCKPERRFDGFHDPICPERRRELLTEQDCPFRKEDTPNEARTLMIRAVNGRVSELLGELFMP